MNGALPKRTNPRRRTLLRLEAGAHDRERVTNLSVNGMFVTGATVADAERGALWIPGEDRPFELTFRHVYQRPSGIGVHFDPVDRRTRSELQAYVHHHHEQARLQAIEAQLLGAPANLKPIAERESTNAVLRPMEKSRHPLRIHPRAGHPGILSRIAAIDEYNSRITLLLDAPAQFDEFDPVFLSMNQGQALYLADTVVESRSGAVATIMLPERLFRPERRRLEREGVAATHLRFFVGRQERSAQVFQCDANGLAVLAATEEALGLSVGDVYAGCRLVRSAGFRELQPLRVAWRQRQPDGQVAIGFERVLPRTPLSLAEQSLALKPPTRAQKAVATIEHLVGSALGRVGIGDAPAVQPWVMSDQEGRPLVHLVNATFDLTRPPAEFTVVLIPPPYGRTKETPSVLALTLVETFRAARLPVLVLRWDGINHVGESWRDERCGAAEHAMLRYTQSQAVQDLATTVASLRARFVGQKMRTVVVSFSLAAVATRRYLAAGGPGIDYWISAMGAADARDTIQNGNGGVDLVGMKRRGENLGIRLIHGHLVDADRHCQDLLDHGFADLEDARHDMALITQPVTWLCGRHDFWVNVHRVMDAMTVPASGARDVIELPTGHFLRTSTEALATFRFIGERCVQQLHGRTVKGLTPPTWVMEGTLKNERSRLRETPFDAVVYWRDYLLGNRDNPLGFDLLALTDEYEQLMNVQIERLGLASGMRVVDLGCGTGNALATMVRSVGDRAPGLVIDAVDLVPEVLERARRNVAAAASEIGVAPPTIRYQVVDLTLRERPNLPFAQGSVDAVLMSLVLPYVGEPGPLLDEVVRILRPGGRLVVSTLRPDVDMSGTVARLRQKLERGDTQVLEGWGAARLGSALRDYLNRAASLLEFELDGRFRFHEREELEARIRRHGLVVQAVEPTFGDPPLALVLTATKDG